MDQLLVFRVDDALSEDDARAKADALSEWLVGDTDGIVRAWTGATLGSATLKDPDEGEIGALFDDAELVRISEGLQNAEAWTHLDGPPPTLPAPPLSLKKRPLPVASGVHMRFVFERPLEPSEKAVFDDLQEVFLAEYATPDGEHGEATAAHEGTQADLQLVGLEFPEDDVVRGHAYWFVELTERFFPVRTTEFVGKVVGRERGLRPSWLGPAVVMGAALASSRLLDGADAVRAASLCWLFLPLMITFFSRQYVGKCTWIAAVVNAVVQAAAAVALERPDLLIGAEVGDLTAQMQAMQTRFEWVLYGARLFGLVWAVPYVLGRNRKL